MHYLTNVLNSNASVIRYNQLFTSYGSRWHSITTQHRHHSRLTNTTMIKMFATEAKSSGSLDNENVGCREFSQVWHGSVTTQPLENFHSWTCHH